MHDNPKGWCKQSGEAWITKTNMMFYNKCFYNKKLGFFVTNIFLPQKIFVVSLSQQVH